MRIEGSQGAKEVDQVLLLSLAQSVVEGVDDRVGLGADLPHAADRGMQRFPKFQNGTSRSVKLGMEKSEMKRSTYVSKKSLRRNTALCLVKTLRAKEFD
jgi:hypothetical protein